jgi:hypothetical protein
VPALWPQNAASKRLSLRVRENHFPTAEAACALHAWTCSSIVVPAPFSLALCHYSAMRTTHYYQGVDFFNNIQMIAVLISPVLQRLQLRSRAREIHSRRHLQASVQLRAQVVSRLELHDN